jgi:hypothetical protein
MFDLLCPDHGGLGHVFVHEAAHVVAAVQRRIRFIEVRVLSPDDWVAMHGGDRMSGGVWMSDPDPTNWVPKDPVAALEFLIAGSLAERAVYGHHLDASYAGDVAVWLRGVGLATSRSRHEINAALGCPLEEVVASTKAWVKQNRATIRKVMASLAGVEEATTLTVLDYSDSWRLSEADVIHIVHASSAPSQQADDD